jgi:preprotein translocase subunit SecA
MPGRRYGEGLHQAIEAKEGVKIERENQTLATITYQNFFRLYEKRAGMTGTAKTEEKEFQEIYGMDVVVVPTNRPMIRQDFPDVVYRTEKGKFYAVVEEIAEKYERGQPVLVGTISIEKSERLSQMLKEPRLYFPRLEMRVELLKKASAKQQGEAWDRLRKLLERPTALKDEDLAPFEELIPRKGNLRTAWEGLKRAVHTLAILRQGIPHQVLNAKHHAKEAEIVAQAGRSKTVTIATNMAGRGTDIKLGGNPEYLAAALLEKEGFDRYEWKVELFIKKMVAGHEEEARALAQELGVREELIERIRQIREECRADEERVRSLGGLFILGTERHESRRIDNQLRGRAGRQGDPGGSRFYVSFDDDLMRLFASDRVIAMLDRMGFDDSEPIEHPMVSRSIERAQKRVEDRNFAIRKQLLQFDDVMARQREVIYAQRRLILLGKDEEVKEAALGMVEETVASVAENFLNPQVHPEDWDLEGLKTALLDVVPQLADFPFEELRGLKPDEGVERLVETALKAYEAREAELSPPLMRAVERFVILNVVDSAWKEHLHNLDVLRQGIFLRGYGQRDPFQEYKIEATRLFNEMVSFIKTEVAKFLFRLKVEARARAARARGPLRARAGAQASGGRVHRAEAAHHASAPAGPFPGGAPPPHAGGEEAQEGVAPQGPHPGASQDGVLGLHLEAFGVQVGVDVLHVVQVLEGLHQPQDLGRLLGGKGHHVLGTLDDLGVLHPDAPGLQGLGDAEDLAGLGVDGEAFPFLLEVQGSKLNGGLLGGLGVLRDDDPPLLKLPGHAPGGAQRAPYLPKTWRTSPAVRLRLSVKA